MYLKLSLPMPPSFNNIYRYGKNRIYLTQEGKEYRERIVKAVKLNNVKCFDGNIALLMFVDMYPWIGYHMDIDNRTKGLLDALQHAGIYSNDYQIVQLNISRYEAIKDGFLEVYIIEQDAEKDENGEYWGWTYDLRD